MGPIDMIFDECNDENIILYNENGEETEFEQIALIPMDGATYVILKPVVLLPGMEEDEAIVFRIDNKDGEEMLTIVLDDGIIDGVFEIYYRLLDGECSVD